jgi:Aspartyl protease
MAPQRVVFDTGATLGLTKETAQHAGLVGLATSHTFAAGQQLTLTHGVADSIRIGQVELRNVPLTWPDQIWFPELPDGTLPAGVVGTDIFYRFLATLDYAGRSLVLRRKTRLSCGASGRRPAGPAPRSCHSGWRPTISPAPSGASTTTGRGSCSLIRALSAWVSSPLSGSPESPASSWAIRARAAFTRRSPRRSVSATRLAATCPGWSVRIPAHQANVRFRPDLFAFEVIGAFAHDFYKPFAVTFDFVDMNLYITEALMSGSTAWLPGHRGGRCVVRCAAVG